MQAEIYQNKGVTGIRINGKVYPFAATRSFRPEGRIIKSFSEYGIHFFNVFPSGIMTALCKRTEPYSKFGPVWIDEDEYNWDNLKKQCDEFFPNLGEDTYIALTIHLDPPAQFMQHHPELRDHWEQMIQNMSSEEWKQAAEKYMCALIDKMEEWYPDRVYAIFLLSGGTTEWYSYCLDQVIEEPSELHRQSFKDATGHDFPSAEVLRKGSDGVFRHPVQDQVAVEYWQYANRIVTDTILRFAHTAKVHTKGDKLVGLFHGHLAGLKLDLAVRCYYNELDHILESPNIDMLFCPASYVARKLSSTSAMRAPVDSIAAANKLFIHEIDSATNLIKKSTSQAAVDHAKGRDEEFSCTDQTKMYLRRESGISLAKGMGYWWFDMFSGYYDDPELMQELADIHQLQEKLMGLDNTNLSEVVEILDQRSAYYLETASRYPMVEHQSAPLNYTGAPWDLRIAKDLFTDPQTDKYKLYYFSVLFAPDQALKDKIAQLRAMGKNMLFAHAPGYITDGGFSEAAMEELTGIRLRRCELTDNTIEACGVTFDFNNENKPGDCHFKTTQDITQWHQLSPVFYAENLDVVLGRFKENGKPAVGLKFRPDGSFDAFCANVPIPTEVLREIFVRAGIFMYADRPTAVYTNKSFACVYSIEGGDITLYRPQEETFVEHFTGETITIGPEGTTVHFEPQSTRMLYRK